MLQVEIYEYNQKLSEIYHNYYNQFEVDNSNENKNKEIFNFDENLKYKFQLVKKLNHPNIAKYLDFKKEDNNYVFISEYCGESLDGIIDIKLNENSSFKIGEIKKILYQILLAVFNMERKGSSLRFLEPRRILVQDDYMIKIQNYVVDLLFEPSKLKFIQNFKYLAPELIFFPENLPSLRSVIWSVGIICLEMLMNINKFSSYQNLFYYYNSDEYLKDLIEILLKYKDSSIFLKSEKNVNYECEDPRILLEFYLNGHFLNKDELSDDFKDFIYNCLQVDGDRRKSAEYLLHHPLFADLKPSLDKTLENHLFFLSPIGSEAFTYINIFNTLNESLRLVSSEDNYEIFSNILKIDVISFLKKKGIISYKPKLLDIPQYFSLHFPESEDYSIGDYENELNYIKKIKNKQMKNSELVFDKELNESLFNEGSLILIGNTILTLPRDYEKEHHLLEKVLTQNDFSFLAQNSVINNNNNNTYANSNSFKNENQNVIGMAKNSNNNNNNSLLSDTSSGHSKFSYAEPKASNYQNTNSLNLHSKSSGVLSINLNSNTNINSINTNNNNSLLEKEINTYLRIKNIVYKIIYKIDNFKRDDLIIELKKTNYSIPNNLRFLIYCIILDIDYIVQSEEYEIGNFYENKDFIINEMKQIKKDIVRCEEYDLLYKSEEGKSYLKSLFEALLYNKEDFFYIQGMDSIASAFIKLYYPDKEIYYQVFYKFIKKLTFNFLDIEKKSIKNLEFNHLVISRMLAFIEPELFVYLDSIEFFEDLYASCWLLTLFSRTFRNENLFKIWDILILEDINIIYLIICLIIKENKRYIMGNTKDTIMIEFINEFSNSIKVESLMHEALKLYKFIPHSLMPINYEYHEEVFEELKKNEYFRDRWWLFENYFADNTKYNVPVITFEDVTKIFEKVIFLDIRSLQEYENIRIKDSCFLSLEKNKYFDTTMNIIENSKGNKLFVLVNNKGGDFKEKVMFLLNKKIKFVCILIGGIDVVFIDEPNLICIRK